MNRQEDPEERLSVQDLIRRLSGLGLDEDESAIYVHLTIMGASKASEIAKALRMDRTKTYRTLQSLVKRGFATATLSRPSRFEAAAAEKLFEGLIEQERERLDRIEKTEIEIAASLATLRSHEKHDLRRNTFKVLHGRREIYRQMERMVKDCSRALHALSTHPAAMTMTESAGILQKVLDKARSGVVVRSVMRRDPKVLQQIGRLPEIETMRLRTIETQRLMRYIIRDSKELLIWVVSDPSSRLSAEEDVAIWTDAEDFVSTQEDAFERIWERAGDVLKTSEPGSKEEPSGPNEAAAGEGSTVERKESGRRGS